MSVTNDQEMARPKPTDPLIGKLRKLREHVKSGWIKREMDLRVGQRVGLPAWDDELHRGTVSAVESDRFRVSWDRENDERGRPRQRQRHWYSIDLIDHFVRGN